MVDVSKSKLLTKKVAGIPVIYLLGAAVLILAVIAWRIQANAPSTEEPANQADGTGMEPVSDEAASSDQSAVVGYQGFVATPAPTYQTTGGTQTAAAVAVETNQTWVNKSVTWLVQTGQANGGAAQSALNKYISGEQLSYAEGTLRDASIKQFGPPPEYVETGGTGAQPTAPGKSQGPLPRGHKVMGPNDDTYAEIARIYYGSGNLSANIIRLRSENYNRLAGDGPFPVGSGVWVPKYVPPRYYTSTKVNDTAAEIAKINGTRPVWIENLNPGMRFPVKPGTRVRVA